MRKDERDEMTEKKDRVELVVSASPHIRKGATVERIMYAIALCLFPAIGASVYWHGLRILPIVAVSVIGAILAEYIAMKLMKKRFYMDGSALVTGLVLGLMMPPYLSYSQLWLPFIGSVFAIAIVKQAFGGLGQNIWSPAAGGFLFCMLSWEGILKKSWVPVVTEATPLSYLNSWELPVGITQIDYLWNLFLGGPEIYGAIGEASVLALLMGGIILICLGYIDWRIPLSFIGTTGLLLLLVSQNGVLTLSHLFAGGLFLGAFFIATERATSPLTGWGKVLFGIGCGALVFVIRIFASATEGVAYSIILMNTFTPLIDRFLKTRPFGEMRKKGKKEKEGGRGEKEKGGGEEKKGGVESGK